MPRRRAMAPAAGRIRGGSSALGRSRMLEVLVVLVTLGNLGALVPVTATAGGVAVEWKNGLHFAADDGSARIQVGGRLFYDAAFLAQDDELEAALGNLPDGTEVRAGRLFVAGTLDGRVGFKVQYDFAGGIVALKDTYLQLKHIPLLGSIKVGHFKEPFGLEELTSSRFVTFTERSLANAFVPGRNAGIQVGGPVLNDRVTWTVGGFRDADKLGRSQGDGDYAVTARVTALAVDDAERRTQVHVGIAGSLRSPRGDVVSFASRPETHLAPELVNTGDLAADNLALLNAELAAVVGPVSVQSEFAVAGVDDDASGDPTFRGWYVQASWFLTGESRSYKAAGARFDRVQPRSPFTADGGVGAWELAARFSSLDLDDAPVAGGQLRDVTAGVNWYLNAQTRWMIDYVLADLDGSGEGHLVTSRFQVDF